MKSEDVRKISDAPTIGVGGDATFSSGVGAVRAPSSTGVLEIGQVIGGRFEIQELLGVGGMGAVYKAHDRDIDRVIALKCIRPELMNHPEVVQRFTQELLLARQVSHKNVIRIFDVRDSGGIKFITMEYVEGRDLGTIMDQRGKLPAKEALGIVRQVCAGLAAAHAEGVVHRDLKPSNIMIEPNGRVVVMDFGLAGAQKDQDMLTKTGAIMGTFQYMSPEQAKGERAGPQSDIFTVGIILYELLTGHTPYKSDSSIASLLKRTQEAAVPPSTLESTIPRALNAIVCRCLDRDMKVRYKSADELLVDLDAAQEGRSASHLPSLVGRRGQAKWLIGLTVTILLALVGAGILGRWLATRNGSAPTAHAVIKILLADFQNQTSDNVFDGTLESSFALAMEGAPFISAYNRAVAHKTLAQIKPGAATLDEANASLVALREGLNVVISGTVRKDGDAYRIECKAVDPVNSKTLETASSGAVPKSGVLQAVGDLAGKMRRTLGDTTPESVRKQQQETVTSSSLEAVHEYALAQNLQLGGKWQEALQQYERAVALDPDMGRAYAGMAVMSSNLGRKADAEKYYQAAMAHIDRMTDREKYRTRGGYYLITRQPEKAIEEYNSLAEQYPADPVGLPNLAVAYFYTRDMNKAMDAGKRAVDAAPKVLANKHNYALYSIYAGKYAEGVKAAQEVLEQDPKEIDALKALAMGQMGLGDFAAATATYQKMGGTDAVGASVANAGLADLAAYQGNNGEAIALLTKGIPADLAGKDQSSAATKSIALAQAHLAQGDKAKAIALADEAVKLSPDPSTMMAAGEIYIAANDLGRAGKIVTQLSSKIAPEPQIYSDLLTGSMALRKNQVKDALEAFQKAQKISNTWLGHFYLGKAYLQSGSFTEADSEFELCLKRQGEVSAVFLDDVPTFRLLPQVYYYLGRAQEGLKSPAAAESYKTFLKMQPQGNNELVADAKKRLGGK